MAAGFTKSSHSSCPFVASPPPCTIIPCHLKKGVWGQRYLVVVKCEAEGSKSSSSSSFRSQSETTLSSSFFPSSVDSGISAYRWCAALGGIGLLETTYHSLTASHILSTTTHLSSLFGDPLPLFGMFAYGLVSILGLELQLGPKRIFDLEKTQGEMILIATTTSMAIASAYFLYIQSTEFGGDRDSCIYCLASATLSFSLFFITLKKFGLDKIKKMLGSQLCIASLVVIALTTSYIATQPVPSSLAAEMPYVETKITKESSPVALSLARHLRSIGAKLYGAFWCTHCVDQKQMFGREAAELLDYVECFPDGVREGTEMANACYDVELKGFPTWEINGQVLSGRKQLSELAKLSGIKLEDLSE